MNTGEFELLIENERRKKKISQELLGWGICHPQQVSKIENSEKVPDFFLAELLMQRLGKTLGSQEIFFGLEEYEEVERRDDILEDLCRGRLDNAQKKLQDFCRDDDGTMGSMNRSRLEGIFASEKGDYAAAEESFLHALSMTMGGKGKAGLLKQLEDEVWSKPLAGIEIETLTFLAQVWLKARKREPARKLLENLWNYVREKVTDEEERARLEARLAVLLGGMYYEARGFASCVRLCEEALELLREHGLVSCMAPLLGMLSEAYGKVGKPYRGREAACWKETVEWLYAYFEIDLEAVNKLYFHSCFGQYYLIGEVVREERKAQGLNQEQLAEGIYNSPENLSRVENGRKPSNKSLKKLLERLGISRQRYTGRVITDEYDVLEMYEEIANLQMRKEYDEAERVLKRLRKDLDMSNVNNRQLVEGIEIGMRYKRENIRAEEAMQQTLELLKLTYHIGGKGKRVPFGNEALLMNQICNLLVHMGRVDDAIAAQRQIVGLYQGSRVKLKYHFRSVYLIIDNMARNMTYLDYDEAEYWSRLNIIDQLQNGKGNAVHLMLGNLMDIKEKDQELCKTFAKIAYHLTDIFKLYHDQECLEKYNREQFHGEIQWD